MIARFALTIAMATLGGMALAATPSFERLYNDSFPKHQRYNQGSKYRDSFDRLLRGPRPPASAGARTRHLYDALRGDPAAFHAFVNSAEQCPVRGYPSERWSYQCLLLLLRLGDERFSSQLAREKEGIRNLVGGALEPLVAWGLNQFPKTRSVYTVRYVRPPVT
jgi:hypothetical protein